MILAMAQLLSLVPANEIRLHHPQGLEHQLAPSACPRLPCIHREQIMKRLRNPELEDTQVESMKQVNG